jgi:hypothetical protein
MSNNTEIVTVLTPEIIDAWVLSYESNRKLPQQKVPCSSGNGTLTPMFGDNLHKRVLKFGGIRNLLENFVCREGRARAKAEALLAKLEAKTTAVAEAEAAE